MAAAALQLEVEAGGVPVVGRASHLGEELAVFDLFRVEDDRIVEHWDTVEKVPPRDQWQNENGKF